MSANAAWKLTVSVLGALLVAGLGLTGVGCGGAGSNESGNGDDGSGDDGDGGVEAPAAPSGLEARPDSSAARLEWDAVTEANAYNVYRSNGSEIDASEEPLEAGLTSATYSDESAENGTEYVYAVTAVAESEGQTAESDPSGEGSALPFAPPSGLEGTSGDSEVVLSWSSDEGGESHNVYRSESPTSGPEGEPLANGITGTTYTDDDAENGTKYYYRVTSVNANGVESSASSQVGKTPFSDPPDDP